MAKKKKVKKIKTMSHTGIPCSPEGRKIALKERIKWVKEFGEARKNLRVEGK